MPLSGPRCPSPWPKPSATLGVQRLYTHQVEAITRIRRGEHVVIVTPTSSSKTLSFNLPIFESLLQDPSGRALYLFPLNALVNDQLKAMARLNQYLAADQRIRFTRYTGQMSQADRQQARADSPHIYLTNPEMLHLSFLGSHDRAWRDFWPRLRYVVIDEVHVYRGVFGSNVAQLLRRLRRVARHYGADPQFICCSATIANPGQLAQELTGLPFTVVDNDGSGAGEKLFVMWNPPTIGEKGLNLRRSYASEAVSLLLDCIKADFNTILFARARKLTERMLRMGQQALWGDGTHDLADKISSYRAGYLTEQREEIEQRLKAGSLKGVISTNALELGIDIGDLDAAILASFPGTIMSTWQQAGRAGRRGRDTLIVLVASQNPVDQYYLRHPGRFFDKPHEQAVVDLNNPYIVSGHLLCAAYELPITRDEWKSYGPLERRILTRLEEMRALTRTSAGFGRWTLSVANRDQVFPHRQVSLRSATQETYHILDARGNEVGSIEPPNVFRETHVAAIYQHLGESYRVIELDQQQRIVRVEEETSDHYTRPMSDLGIAVGEVYHTRQLAVGGIQVPAGLGRVIVQERIHAYQEVRFSNDEVLETVTLPEPYQVELETTAAWLQLPEHLQDVVKGKLAVRLWEGTDDFEEDLFAGGLHALEHVMVGVLPLLVMCDRSDVDGFYQDHHSGLGAPAVFVYDRYQGGIGLAEKAFHSMEEILVLAFETVVQCQCDWGCPSCVQSGTCRFRNETLDKDAAEVILGEILGQPYRLAPRRVVQPKAERPAPILRPQTSPPVTQHSLRERAQGRLREAMEQMQREAMRERHSVKPRWQPGDRVWHLDLGAGIVVASRVVAGSEIVTVKFDLHQEAVEINTSHHTLKPIISTSTRR